MKGVLINGKFFTQKITGVQRYAIEIVNMLDKLTSPGQLEIAIPPNAKNVPQYQNIRVRTVEHFTGISWEQFIFPVYALHHQKIPVNLCNASPLLFPGIVCVHDVKIKVHPEYFSFAFRIWYRLLFGNSIRRAKKVITVSEFSKREINRCYRRPLEQIDVVPSCWEHYAGISYDENALKKYGLSAKKYLFALGSMDPNKNFQWIADVARQHPDCHFAVAGSINEKIFSEKMAVQPPANMQFLGYVSDEEAKTLMRECYAFLFPSFYEGFGLPPLEALSAGAKRVIVSDIPVMHEVFGDAVNYIDPYDKDFDLARVDEISEAKRNDILKKYSWEKSARKLLTELKAILD